MAQGEAIYRAIALPQHPNDGLHQSRLSLEVGSHSPLDKQAENASKNKLCVQCL